MRLATFNLLHGRSLSDGRVESPRLMAAVAALDADVLALQEVDRGQGRSGNLDQTALAADALAAGEHRFAAAVVGEPGGQVRPLTHDDDGEDEPRYGVGLVSRYPIISWQIIRLNPAPVRAPIYVPGSRGGLVLLRDEPRVVLAVVLRTPHGPLTVATTHLSFVPGWNARQLRQTVRALRVLPAPRILLGDLNLPAGAARLLTGWRCLARRPTYPAGQPRIQLDHVLADRHDYDRLPPVTAVRTPLSVISDHRPLVVDLD